MKKIIPIILLLLSSAFAWAGEKPNSAYNITVHVSRSRLAYYGNTGALELNVLIDGRKYELRSSFGSVLLLSLGDYKAKLTKDDHRGTTYASYQVYEFLLPDHTTRKFTVVGQEE